jgi:hypothetical protein
VSGGLSFPSVSLALRLAPGGWDFRLVAAGSADCNTALPGLPDSINVTLDTRGHFTFAGVGYVVALFWPSGPEGSPFDAADSQPTDLPANAIEGVGHRAGGRDRGAEPRLPGLPGIGVAIGRAHSLRASLS